jgi:valyl-tRNA synthetase
MRRLHKLDRAHANAMMAKYLVFMKGVSVHLPMADLISVDKEITRVQKQIEAAAAELAGLRARLSSPGFRGKARAEVVAAAEAAEREKSGALSKLSSSLEALKRAQAEQLVENK